MTAVKDTRRKKQELDWTTKFIGIILRTKTNYIIIFPSFFPFVWKENTKNHKQNEVESKHR